MRCLKGVLEQNTVGYGAIRISFISFFARLLVFYTRSLRLEDKALDVLIEKRCHFLTSNMGTPP